jgi:hypothetical protein
MLGSDFKDGLVMTGRVEYRILERQKPDGSWSPFAVAYRHGSRFLLFAPPWRAHRQLPVESLGKLTENHYPSRNFAYRWLDPQVYQGEVTHPIQLLRQAAGDQLPGRSGTIDGQIYDATTPRRDPEATPIRVPRTPKPPPAGAPGTHEPGDTRASSDRPQSGTQIEKRRA